ncbi:Calcium-binding EF-hand [Cynara cardunculus var. scolymus]|uniref:Mitochondrial proton/calcium exchanger protein n=1 Tax=Cynara cardunculus var. scolymus TaxID=59895 RepID=A0A124SEK4_CYNCS|nr:Calcium-binding EF-hand [Cynara cardunculus var. scolymus]
MASRAILRRRRLLSDYLHISSRSIQGLSHDFSTKYSDPGDSSSRTDSPLRDLGSRKYDNPTIRRREEFKNFSELGFFRPHKFYTITGNGTLGDMLSMRIQLVSQSSSFASIATAHQPNLGGEDEDNEKVSKRKEASPEECDQAVEGLSSAKAKVKAKQVSEPPKAARSIFQRIWAMLLGIGPALRAVASMSREDWAKKLVHWKNEFVSTLKHYWLGTKLLGVDVKISSRLLLKLASGKSLSRRERQQLTRTTADIFRLVPVAVFIIVPFMEFLLPVFLKLFPNMLPSTFQDKMKEQEALKRRLNARIEYAKFLQDTAKEMAKEVQNTRSGEIKKTAEDLDDFLSKASLQLIVRKGAMVANEEILGFAKLFNDELTLDNISRPRLVNMCKYMGIQPYGTDAYLRYMLRKRLQWIKNDDKMIQAEGGVDALSEDELREDCRERGMLGLLSVEEMRQQLRDWLDLSLNHSVPSSLLILSRAFTVSGKLKPEEVVSAALSSLPDEVVDTVGITSLPSEDSLSERRRKLEFLEMQDKIIKEEEEKEEEEQAKMKQSVGGDTDVALEEMINATASEVQEEARAKALDKQEKLCKVSEALAVLASASSVSREREEFLRLVNKEKEIDDVDAKIGDRWRVLDRDYDGKVTPEEVASAAMYLKDTLGKEGVQELISNLSKDKEGKILVEDIVKLGSRSEEAD